MFSDALKKEIEGSLLEGELRCAAAFKLGDKLCIKPVIIGQAADEMDVHLSRCQLGLFGYGPKAEGKHRIVKPMEEVPAQLQSAIEAVAADKGLTCLQAWQIASDLSVPKMDVSSACETLGYKITVCQLGAFPRPKLWQP